MRPILFRYYILCVVLIVCISYGSQANETTVEYDPSVTGQLVPRAETDIQVLKEKLDIRFQKVDINKSIIAELTGQPCRYPIRVDVTAEYALYNPTTEIISPDIAFPILRGGPEEHLELVRLPNFSFSVINASLPEEVRRGVRGTVRVNGNLIESEYVSFESLFEKERSFWVQGIREWLQPYPAIRALLDNEGNTRRLPDEPIVTSKRGFKWLRAMESNFETFRQTMDEICTTATLGSNAETISNIIRHQWLFHATIDEWDIDCLSFIYTQLHPEKPDEVKEFMDIWGREPRYLHGMKGYFQDLDELRGSRTIHWDLAQFNRRIDFMRYRPTLKPGKTTSIRVDYSHLMDAVIYPNDEDHFACVQQYQYILTTSKKWKSFGPINISISIDPELIPYTLSLPMTYKGTKRGMHCYAITIPSGSQVTENLHVGRGEIAYNTWDIMAQDRYPAIVKLPFFWEQYKRNPDGPFAKEYLRIIVQKVEDNSYISPADCAYLCKELNINPSAYMATTLEEEQKIFEEKINEQSFYWRGDERLNKRIVEGIEEYLTSGGR